MPHLRRRSREQFSALPPARSRAPQRTRLGPGVRLDTGVYQGWAVPMDYDPLLAKLAVWAPTREHAAARAIRALSENITWAAFAPTSLSSGGYCRDPEFRAGHLHTGFIEEFFLRDQEPAPTEGAETVAALVAALDASMRNEA